MYHCLLAQRSTELPHRLLVLIRPPLSPPVLPYTTLFRSRADNDDIVAGPDGVGEMRRRDLGLGIATLPLTASVCSLRVTSRSRSEEHTSELQSRGHLVCRLPPQKKNRSK